MPKKSESSSDRLNKIVAGAQRNQQQREQAYREQALKLYPWICGRCQREFARENLQELTVHHRNHNHDDNPADGSNWELLCLYCHDNEHQRLLEAAAQGQPQPASARKPETSATHNPFANLKNLLKDKG
jgi:5-methylcytosine-specific restriction endonuclease McrA